MRPIKTFGRLALIGLLGLAGGCLYRLPIQQGNVLNHDLVTQLQPGMTQSQVKFLLGTPMLPNGFDADRWDYYCYAKMGRGEGVQTRRLSVWFKDEKVDHFDGDAIKKAEIRDICTG